MSLFTWVCCVVYGFVMVALCACLTYNENKLGRLKTKRCAEIFNSLNLSLVEDYLQDPAYKKYDMQIRYDGGKKQVVLNQNDRENQIDKFLEELSKGVVACVFLNGQNRTIEVDLISEECLKGA